MTAKETEALWAFAEDHNCIRGCAGCIGESTSGCNHPDHPQNLTTAAEVVAHD